MFNQGLERQNVSLDHITITYYITLHILKSFFKYFSFLSCSGWHEMHFILLVYAFWYHVGFNVILCLKRKPHETNLWYITVTLSSSKPKICFQLFLKHVLRVCRFLWSRKEFFLAAWLHNLLLWKIELIKTCNITPNTRILTHKIRLR